jgi:FkbM family methyltransferase
MQPELVATRYGLLQTPGANDLISRFLRDFGEWAWLEADFVGGFVQPGQRVLDGGAYMGSFTLGLAARRPAQVVAVEANPAVLGLLQHNLTTLAADWATLEHGLLGDGCSAVPAPRATHPNNLGATSFTGGPSLQPGATGEQTVPPLSLRGLRERHGPFDLIKLDVEGFELITLQGDADWLAEHRPTLWLECNEDPAVLPLFDYVQALGYELHCFAFPSFNPENHNRNPKPIFAVSYEAGLLAVRPDTEVTMPPLQARTGCDLVRVQDREHLRRCLWLTPRWGEAEWADMPRSRLLALCARLSRRQEFAGFLARE